MRTDAVLHLWADAFRRAQKGHTVAVRTEVGEGSGVHVAPVDMRTEAVGTIVPAVVIASECVSGCWWIRLRF